MYRDHLFIFTFVNIYFKFTTELSQKDCYYKNPRFSKTPILILFVSTCSSTFNAAKFYVKAARV